MNTATRHATALLLIWPVLGFAQSPWDSDRKEAFIDRCQIRSDGDARIEDPAAYCRCYASGLEQRFGKEEYPRIARSRPDPQGDALARAMADQARQCALAQSFSLPEWSRPMQQ